MSDEWGELISEIVSCQKCHLHRSRKNAVPGEGDVSSKVMFVGEAPGAVEDETGRPFVGAAGKLLTSLMESIGMKRSSVYITNVVKCRPPSNRDPTEEEINACSPYLVRQIELIRPKLIVCLGRHSSKFIFESAGLKWISMSAMHGRVFSARLFGIDVKLIATYHPAAAIYNPGLRKDLERDFQLVASAWGELRESSTRRSKTILDFIS